MWHLLFKQSVGELSCVQYNISINTLHFPYSNITYVILINFASNGFLVL